MALNAIMALVSNRNPGEAFIGQGHFFILLLFPSQAEAKSTFDLLSDF